MSMASIAKQIGRLSKLKIWNRSLAKRFDTFEAQTSTFHLKRNMSSNSEPDVLLETINNVGVITLNRAKALNALNLNMVRLMQPQLEQWKAEGIGLILIKGNLCTFIQLD